MAPFLETTALALRVRAPTCPATPSCPQDDSCTLLSNGASVQVNCATDYYGGDLQLIHTSTLAGCVRACTATSLCVAASYVGQNCYMKSVLTAGQATESSVGVIIISREPAPAPGPPVIPTACPTSFTCPENNGCTLRGANSQVFALSCGTDYYGGDFLSMWAGSLSMCAQACVDNSQCIAASYTGGQGSGTCYLKDKNYGASVSENADAIAIDTRVVPSPSATSTILSSTAVSSSISTSVAVSSSTSSVASSTSVESSSSVSSTLSPTPTPSSSSATPTSTSVSTPPSEPVPTQVILNGDFESNGYAPWSLNGFALVYGTVTGQSTTSPRNGEHSFQAQGESTNNYWLMDMSQTVTVVPGQAYDVSIWSRQAIYGNCDITVNYNDGSLFDFKPDTSYAEQTGRIEAVRSTGAEAVLRLSVQCGRGGSQGRLWMDDITMTQVQS